MINVTRPQSQRLARSVYTLAYGDNIASEQAFRAYDTHITVGLDRHKFDFVFSLCSAACLNPFFVAFCMTHREPDREKEEQEKMSADNKFQTIIVYVSGHSQHEQNHFRPLHFMSSQIFPSNVISKESTETFV